MNLFIDTSAFIKRYVNEQGSDEVERLCSRADDIGISILLPVEVVSTISRLKREKRLSARQYAQIKETFFSDIRDATVVTLTPGIIKNAIHEIERSPLKTVDALHIGCALEYRPDYFVSSDAGQLFAAARAGLETSKIQQ